MSDAPGGEPLAGAKAEPLAGAKAEPALLVVAGDPGRRRALAALVDEPYRAEAVTPEALREPSRFVDAPGALVWLDARAGEAGLARLAPLRALPAAGALVLVTRDVEGALLEAALAALEPLQVLSDPPPPALLAWALARALPASGSGRGARAQQRRATTLLGVSAAIRDVLAQVRRVAPTRVPVLVLGETGTGKELVARALHQQSPRAARPFVAINCGAVPETLLESELFGYERGAFTGASSARPGLFEQAHGGTLFLDEVGDMPAALQVKLLRALETGQVRRLGATAAREVDVRILSATHRDLEAAVREEHFREDLLYRINTVMLHLPPLRRRPVDVPFLAQHFAEEFGESHARRISLSEEFLEALSRHSFPGNVRELRNAVERAIALAAPDEPISARHLSEHFAAGPAFAAHGTLRERIEAVEHHAIREALAATGGNRTHAAERLGLSRLGLRKKMRRLGLEPTT